MHHTTIYSTIKLSCTCIQHGLRIDSIMIFLRSGIVGQNRVLHGVDFEFFCGLDLDNYLRQEILWSRECVGSLVSHACCDFSTSTSLIFMKISTNVLHLSQISPLTFESKFNVIPPYWKISNRNKSGTVWDISSPNLPPGRHCHTKSNFGIKYD